MGKLVTVRDRNLLLDSDITKGYSILVKFLNETPNLDERYLNILGKNTELFFNDIYPKIIKDAI